MNKLCVLYFRQEVEQDTSAFDIVKAVQYGAFDRVQGRSGISQVYDIIEQCCGSKYIEFGSRFGIQDFVTIWIWNHGFMINFEKKKFKKLRRKKISVKKTLKNGTGSHF